MLKKPSEKKKLNPVVFKGEQLSDELKSLIEDNDILSISGTLGIKEGYQPIEYEEVKIKADGNVTIIRIYNKGMSMMTAETPELKQVFQFCNMLYELTQ